MRLAAFLFATLPVSQALAAPTLGVEGFPSDPLTRATVVDLFDLMQPMCLQIPPCAAPRGIDFTQGLLLKRGAHVKIVSGVEHYCSDGECAPCAESAECQNWKKLYGELVAQADKNRRAPGAHKPGVSAESRIDDAVAAVIHGHSESFLLISRRIEMAGGKLAGQPPEPGTQTAVSGPLSVPAAQGVLPNAALGAPTPNSTSTLTPGLGLAPGLGLTPAPPSSAQPLQPLAHPNPVKPPDGQEERSKTLGNIFDNLPK